jgi:prepilin-type N-terminal cleavage/methylation domain-containing protein
MLCRSRQSSGFTLIELMIVVAIIAILAMVAIPAFMKYIRRSKTTEATMNVRKLYDSSVSYFETERVKRGANDVMIYRQFPDTFEAPPPGSGLFLQPVNRCCGMPGGKCKHPPDLWQFPTWQALNFSVDDPFYFQYRYASSGTESTSQFTAGAYGDLDCNNVYSTYERTGMVDSVFNVQGGGGLYIANDIE